MEGRDNLQEKGGLRSLCNTRKGSLQDKAANSEILIAEEIARKKGHLAGKVKQENIHHRFKGQFL